MAKVSTYQPDEKDSRILPYAQKLSRMIQFETVSYPGVDQRDKFLGFHKVLEELFPLVHKTFEKTEIDGNLLFYWKGAKHDKPVLLMSHQDVVPAEGKWQHEPFSGDIINGEVWGRGSADIKCGVFAFMQAMEELIEEGYSPEQDIYLASSCTEEVGGDGAPKLVAELEKREVRPFLVCDEGGAIVTDPIAGVKGNFAMVGVFEKGMLNLRITAKSNGGHSSTPPKNAPIDRLAFFITEIKKRDPFKVEISEYVRVMFDTMAPYCDGALGFIMKHNRPLSGLIKMLLPKVAPKAAAMLETTVAFTMQSGSEAYNVLPQEASVVANLRIIPHQNMEESIALMKKIAAKYDLEVKVINGNDASKPISIHGEGWKKVERTINKVFPGLPVSPYVVIGGTDARFYGKICDNCIRFTPVIFGPKQMAGMHGIDECMSAACLPGAVDYFKEIVKEEKI